jgi:hypothetical protein
MWAQKRINGRRNGYTKAPFQSEFLHESEFKSYEEDVPRAETLLHDLRLSSMQLSLLTSKSTADCDDCTALLDFWR